MAANGPETISSSSPGDSPRERRAHTYSRLTTAIAVLGLAAAVYSLIRTDSIRDKLDVANQSVVAANADRELLRAELRALQDEDFDLDVVGFDTAELDRLLAIPEEEDRADAVPPLPAVAVSRPADLWLLGEDRRQHRVLCGDATKAEAVAQLLGSRKPKLMVTDPPYGIELDSEWRDRAGLNGCGPAEPSYMKRRSLPGENLPGKLLAWLPPPSRRRRWKPPLLP